MSDHLVWCALILGGAFVWGCALLAQAICAHGDAVREAIPRNVNWNTVVHHAAKRGPDARE